MIEIFQIHANQLHVGAICLEHGTVEHDYALHIHDCYELEILYEGHGTQWLNGNAVAIAPGSLYLLSPSDSHRFITQNVPMNFLTVKIDGNAAPDFIAKLLEHGIGGAFVQLSPDEFAQTMLDFDKLERELRGRGQYYEECAYACLVSILVRLLRPVSHLRHLSISHAAMYLHDALQYIQTHLSEPIALKDVAAACGLSPCYLSSLFSQNVGCNYSQYLMERRVYFACQLLDTTDQTVYAIAYASGFGSISNFQRAFKLVMHTSALQYRKR